ncbi:MAG: Histidine kinase [Segetibacter sp.]|nr:Histidine kinase [Segetibacter sp.]
MDIKIQQAVMQSQLEIYQAALEHLSGNIDNHIGQIAAAVKFKIAAMQLTGKQNSLADIEETQVMLSELIKGLQHISNNSYIVCLSEMDIISAVEMEVERFSRVADLRVRFSLKGAVYRFSTEKTILLFRTWQQVMCTLFDAGQCEGLLVTIMYKPQLVSIRVSSDSKINAFFFTGDIYERAQLVGIKYTLENKNTTATPNSIILELTTC